MQNAPLDITIRCGFEFAYEASGPTPIILLIQPRLNRWQRIEAEKFIFHPNLSVREYEDHHGNIVRRLDLPMGRSTISHDAFVSVPSLPENFDGIGGPISISDLPPSLLPYTLPSRYCDSDRLMDFAFQQFGQVEHGLPRVRTICDWVHKNIEYRWGAGSPFTTASEVVAQRFGVCRDFAHTAIALCRCFNLPARYVTGYVPDVAYRDNGSPMDFHAYMEVYLGGHWHTFDARFNVPRTARIKIACGMDAVDGAFSTLYGAANLASFNVWAYQIDPLEVKLGDPVDLSKRLCGTPELLFPPRKKTPDQ